MTIEENVPLAAFTTFRIGGAARFFVRVDSLQELQEAIAFANEKILRVLVLGGGSNMLIDDEGFDGLVIKIDIRGIEILQESEGAELVVGAGESWDELVARTVEEGLWGIENLSGIPGTVGAAPVQNIGAYGSELKDTFVWAEALDVTTQEMVRLDATACAFSYRSSIFKRHAGQYVILRVALRLSKLPNPKLSYKDLTLAFPGAEPTLPEVRGAVLAIRARKFPDLAVEGTAGSFFLNPIVSAEVAATLTKEYPDLPQYAQEGSEERSVKISLAWLLDNVLGLKGYSVGGARLFESQPLVVVARAGTSSNDVEALAGEVIEKIQKKFNITIEMEVRIQK